MMNSNTRWFDENLQEISFPKLYQLIQNREDFTEEQLFFLYRLVARKLSNFKPAFYFTDAFPR